MTIVSGPHGIHGGWESGGFQSLKLLLMKQWIYNLIIIILSSLEIQVERFINRKMVLLMI